MPTQAKEKFVALILSSDKARLIQRGA